MVINMSSSTILSGLDSAILAATRAAPDFTKIEPFSSSNFKRWQMKLLLVLDIAKVDFVLTKPKPIEPSNEASDEDKKKHESENASWIPADKICRTVILNSLLNERFDMYCS